MATSKFILAGISAFALLSAAPTFALSVSTDLTGTTNVNARAGVDMSAGASSSANSSDASAAGNASADLSIPLVLTQADISAGATNRSIVSANNVQNKTDLSSFINEKLRADADLAGVDTASDHVAVSYMEPEHLFGFIPMHVETTATADASGNVTITGPWWGFLASSDEASLQSKVQSQVNTTLSSNASANAQLSASEQARLVEAIESALAANPSTSASGSVRTQY